MLQAAVPYRLFLDPVPFSDNGFVPAEVDISGRYVVQALVIAVVVVVFYEVSDVSAYGTDCVT